MPRQRLGGSSRSSKYDDDDDDDHDDDACQTNFALKKMRVLVGLNKNLTLANLDVFFSAEVPGSFCEACAKGVVGVCWCF